MKLTNLSLAIMVAVGVAACGGSGDDNSNKPADPPKNNNQSQNDNNNQPTPPAAEPHVVDPTGTQVVDDKDLTKQNTVGTLQYVRREDSQYDRVNNPSKPASASPLLGVTLNDQNPKLTNIVLARQDVTRTDGTAVKAQFTGSDNPMPLAPNGDVIKDSVNGQDSLQAENFKNVDVLAGGYKVDTTNTDTKHVNSANNTDDKGKISRTFEKDGFQYAEVDTDGKRKPAATIAAITTATAPNLSTSDASEVTAIIDPAKWNDGTKNITGRDKDGKDLYLYRGTTAAPAPNLPGKTTVTRSFSDTKNERYGKGLVWWTTPETAFENQFTRTGGVGNEAGAPTAPANMTDSGAASYGLVRIGCGLSTLGQ